MAGNTILVTGGASGLGAGCVEMFASNGWNVTIADLDDDAGERTVTKIGDSACFYKTDVTDSASVQSAINQTIDRFGELRAVVSCAGVLGASRVLGREGPHNLGLFEQVIRVNLTGTFNVLRLAVEAMAGNSKSAEGERGVIINTASVAAFEGQVGQAAYAASKGGIASMTLPIARELAGLGIRVVAIAPGVFLTPMMRAAPEKVLRSLEQQTVFPQRLGEAAEFAALAKHIVENPMLNGTVIRLDGAIRMSSK